LAIESSIDDCGLRSGLPIGDWIDDCRMAIGFWRLRIVEWIVDLDWGLAMRLGIGDWGVAMETSNRQSNRQSTVENRIANRQSNRQSSFGIRQFNRQSALCSRQSAGRQD
jgi:hypothetical protein